ncbi:MAG: LamG domain-containing protein, partial [Kiritimatiellae bacterium]|nr:LamG domain-containing protein [Kiritimatiellia bacterium]
TVVLDAGRSRTDAILFTVAAAGRLTRERAEGTNAVRRTGEPAVTAAAGPKGWTAELRVPFTAVGAQGLRTGEVWGINFQRVCGDEVSQWSPTSGRIGNLNEAGVLAPADRTQQGTATGAAPVVYYDFEAVERDMLVPDRAGEAASPATLRVAPSNTPWNASNLVAGVQGRGLRFGGPATGQYMEIGLERGMNVSEDDFTIAFWCKPEKAAGVLLHSTTSPPYWGLNFAGDGRLRFAMNSGGGRATTVAESRGKLTEGAWHRVVMMFDRGRFLRLYLDGELSICHPIAEQSGALRRTLSIGGPHHFFQGCVDEFTVRRGTFSPGDARALLTPAGDRESR